MSTQPGFNEIPKIRELLTPLKLHSSYRIALSSEVPFKPSIPSEQDSHIHSLIKYSNDYFVTLVYGHKGSTNIRAQHPVQFTIITPDTRQERKVTLNTGESITVFYKYGRIIIGQYTGVTY